MADEVAATAGSTQAMGQDERELAELGYKQELHRGWSSFTNFAISFTIISVLAGLRHELLVRVERRRADRDLDRLADPVRRSCCSSPSRWRS